MRPGELTTLEQMQLMARAAAAQAMSTPSMLRLRLGRYPTRTPDLRNGHSPTPDCAAKRSITPEEPSPPRS